MVEKVVVKDFDDIVEITAALAFKIMLMTFPKLCDEIPVRGNFSFYSGIGCNGRGIIDAAEMVMRVKTNNQIKLDLSYCEEKPEDLFVIL